MEINEKWTLSEPQSNSKMKKLNFRDLQFAFCNFIVQLHRLSGQGKVQRGRMELGVWTY